MLSWTRQDWLGLKIDRSSVRGQTGDARLWRCFILLLLFFFLSFVTADALISSWSIWKWRENVMKQKKIASP